MKFNYYNFLYKSAVAVLLIFLACCQNQVEYKDIPVTSHSSKAKEYFRTGLIYDDQNDFQEARRMYVKALEEDSTFALAYILKSTTDEPSKEQADDIKKARMNLDNVTDYEKLYCDFEATYLNSDWNKRFDVSQKIANDYPLAARSQVDLGNTYSEGTQEILARKCYEKAIEINPKWVGGYMALANSYLLHGPKNFKKAEENALKAVQLAPASAGVQIALGDCYKAQNEFEKARDSFSKAINLDSNISEPYFKKAHVNALLGNYSEARQNYEEGSKHADDKSDAVRFIAYTYLYQGDYNTALNMLMDEVTQIDKSKVSPIEKADEKMDVLTDCASIALHNNDIGRLKEVIDMMRPICEQIGIDIGTEQGKLVQDGTMMHWDALMLASNRKYDEATAKAKEIKSTLTSISDPTKLNDYEFTLGYIAMKQQNYAEAIIRFERTVQTNMYNRYWLAMANLDAGNKERAKAILKKIADYNFNDVGYALIRKQSKDKLATL